MNSMPSFAFSEARITSKGRIMVRPIPTHAPFTAATIGFESRTSRTQSTPAGMPPEPPAVSLPGSTPSMRVWKVSSMSAPAQKPRPSPVITMAPIRSFALARSIAWACSSAMRGVQAFSLSGRASVRIATSPRSS